MDIAEIASSAVLAAAWARTQAEQAQQMRATTVREKGIVNIAQAAVLLDVSRQRVLELLKLGILSRYEFFGHIYLSFREVSERRAQDIKAGRPKRGLIKTLITGLQAAALTDKPQALQGGYAGPYQKEKAAKSRSSSKKAK